MAEIAENMGEMTIGEKLEPRCPVCGATLERRQGVYTCSRLAKLNNYTFCDGP